MLKQLFESKKAVVTIVGLVLEVLVAANILKLDEASRAAFMENTVYLVGAYLGAQGLADFSKERAKAEVKK